MVGIHCKEHGKKAEGCHEAVNKCFKSFSSVASLTKVSKQDQKKDLAFLFPLMGAESGLNFSSCCKSSVLQLISPYGRHISCETPLGSQACEPAKRKYANMHSKVPTLNARRPALDSLHQLP